MSSFKPHIRLRPDYGECHGPAEETPRWCPAVPRGDYVTEGDRDKRSHNNPYRGRDTQKASAWDLGYEMAVTEAFGFSGRSVSDIKRDLDEMTRYARKGSGAKAQLEKVFADGKNRFSIEQRQQSEKTYQQDTDLVSDNQQRNIMFEDQKNSMFRGRMTEEQQELQDLIEELREVTNAGPAYMQVTQAIPSHIWEDAHAAWWLDQADAVKSDIQRMIDDHRRRAAGQNTTTSNLKKQLIRLGEKHPDLRDNLRPVLDEISTTSRRQASQHRRRKAHLRSVDERDLKAELVMTAENDGDAYRRGKDARKAVENAIPQFVKRFQDLMDDLKEDAIKEVHDGWHREASVHGNRRANKRVQDHEVEQHGVQPHQMFRGVATDRRFDDQATGAAFTEHEAMEEALEALAARGWEVDSIPNRLDKMTHVEDAIRKEFPNDPHIDPATSARDQSFYVTVYVKG